MVAVAFVKKAVRLGDFTEEGIKDPAVLALAERVDVEEDEAFTAKYPQGYFVELKITLRDGTVRTLLSDCPSGDPEAKRYRSNPALLASEVSQKTASLLAECGFGERVHLLEECVIGLARSPTLTSLSGILGAHRARQERT